MFFRRFVQRLRGRKEPSVSSHVSESRPSTPKTYSQRYEDTNKMTTNQIRSMIAERESEGKPCGVAYRVLANRSDARAKARNIDPPRPGRKTYSQRYNKTNAMSISDIRTQIAQREAQGKECGVLYRVLSERT